MDCYVLNDSKRTAVISQRGMAAALGFGNTSGTALTSFISSKAIANGPAGADIHKKTRNPVIFKDDTVVGKKSGLALYVYILVAFLRWPSLRKINRNMREKLTRDLAVNRGSTFPPRLSRLLRNRRLALGRELLGPCLPSLKPAPAPERYGCRVLPVIRLGLLRLAGGKPKTKPKGGGYKPKC